MFVNYSQKKSFISKYYAQYDDYYKIKIDFYSNGGSIATFPFLTSDEFSCLIENGIIDEDEIFDGINSGNLVLPVCVYKKSDDVSLLIMKDDGSGECETVTPTSCLCKRCGDVPYNDLPVITDDYPYFYEMYKDEITFINIEDYSEFLNECYKRYISSNHKEHIFENPCGIIYFIDCFNANECVKDDSCCWFNNTCTDLFGSNNSDSPNDPFGVCPYGYQCIEWDVDKNYCKACNCIFKDKEPECIGQDCCLCLYVPCADKGPQECLPDCSECDAKYSIRTFIGSNKKSLCGFIYIEYYFKVLYYNSDGKVCYAEIKTISNLSPQNCEKALMTDCFSCLDLLNGDFIGSCINVDSDDFDGSPYFEEIDCDNIPDDCDRSKIVELYKESQLDKICYCQRDSSQSENKNICCGEDILKKIIDKKRKIIRDKVKEKIENIIENVLKDEISVKDIITTGTDNILIFRSAGLEYAYGYYYNLSDEIKDKIRQEIEKNLTEEEIICANINPYAIKSFVLRVYMFTFNNYVVFGDKTISVVTGTYDGGVSAIEKIQELGPNNVTVFHNLDSSEERYLRMLQETGANIVKVSYPHNSVVFIF